MSQFDEIRSREERVEEFPVGSGVGVKRIRILSDAIVDDFMMNATKAYAAKIKTGRGATPEYGRDALDYLLALGRVRS
jgi:hypothetical protein